jgi:hypothetical protein
VRSGRSTSIGRDERDFKTARDDARELGAEHMRGASPPSFTHGISLGFGGAVAEVWTVPLPPDVREPLEVYLNGVLQVAGTDYEVAGTSLYFSKPLAKEGRLGVLRWLSIAFGIAGTYRKNDSIDVVYEVAGRRKVASGLPITPPDERSHGRLG